MNNENWPFQEEKNVAAFTTKQIIEDNYPILQITHDEEDGGWQILCGTTNKPEDARIVSLYSLYEKDASIGEIADLPLGWIAWRKTKNSEWKREKRNKS